MDGNRQKQVDQQLPPPAADQPNGGNRRVLGSGSGSGSGNGSGTSRSRIAVDNVSIHKMPFPNGFSVLVVDDEQTSLKVMVALLRTSHYKVVSVLGASNALSLLKNMKGGFDLVITNAHLSGMDGFQLMDRVRKLYKIPVIMTSSNDELKLVTKGLERGACFCLLKPYNMSDIQNVWQHVFRKRREELMEIEQTGSVGREPPAASRPASGRAAAKNKQVLIHNVDDLDEDDSASSSRNREVNSRSLNRKRKDRPSSSRNNRNGREEDDDDEDEDEDRQTQKKARVVWNTDLHNQFLDAIEKLGIEKAVPKKILEMMSVEGLTRENVASHLQKYRIFVKKLVEAGQADEPGAAMSIANGALKSSFAAGHSSAFLMSLQQGGYPPYSGAATQPPVPPPITMPTGYGSTSTYRGHPAAPLRSSNFFNQQPLTNNAYIPTAHNPMYGQQQQPAVLPMSNNLQGMNTVLPAPYGLPPYSTPQQQNVVTTGFGMDPYNPTTRISGPMSTPYYGSVGAGHISPGSNLVMGRNAAMPINMGAYQQQNMQAMRPSNFGPGALDQNFNSMNMNVQTGMTNLQTNNPMGTSGNIGSGLFGNNFNQQSPNFNTGITNNNYAGFPTTSTAAYRDIGMNNQMGGVNNIVESSSSRPDVNLCYTNLLNQNLSRIIGKSPMPLYQIDPDVPGSPLPDIEQFGMPNSSYATIGQDGGQAASMVGFTGASNNQVSFSPVFTNVNMTSSQQQQQQQQQYSSSISPSPPEQRQLIIQEQPQQEQQEQQQQQQQEEKTNEELSGDFFDLMTSNTTAEINSLPSLFDDDLLFSDFYFKQYDDDNNQAGAEQQQNIDEVIDPNFSISAYQMDNI